MGRGKKTLAGRAAQRAGGGVPAATADANGIVLNGSRDGQEIHLRLEFSYAKAARPTLRYYDLDHPTVEARVAIAEHYGGFLQLLDGCLAAGQHTWRAVGSDYCLGPKAVERLWNYAVEKGVIDDDGRLWAPVRPQALSRPSALAERGELPAVRNRLTQPGNARGPSHQV